MAAVPKKQPSYPSTSIDLIAKVKSALANTSLLVLVAMLLVSFPPLDKPSSSIDQLFCAPESSSSVVVDGLKFPLQLMAA